MFSLFRDQHEKYPVIFYFFFSLFFELSFVAVKGPQVLRSPELPRRCKKGTRLGFRFLLTMPFFIARISRSFSFSFNNPWEIGNSSGRSSPFSLGLLIEQLRQSCVAVLFPYSVFLSLSLKGRTRFSRTVGAFFSSTVKPSVVFRTSLYSLLISPDASTDPFRKSPRARYFSLVS